MDIHRILVVDENAGTSDSFAYLLAVGGYDVRHAYEAYSAGKIARQFRPQAVLVQGDSRAIDPVDVICQLRQIGEYWNARYIATGVTEGQALRDAGFDAFVPAVPNLVEIEALLLSGARTGARPTVGAFEF